MSTSDLLLRCRRPAMLAVTLLVAGFATPVLASSPLAIPLPEPLPPIRLMTLLTGVHLLGLCFGLGGATMLDFWILRWMRWGGMPNEIARMFEFVGKVTTVGIGLLWLSGLGFLAVYAVESPEKLANPKVWSKVAIVAVLTLNGILIHALVLPKVLRDVRRPILDGFSPASAGMFLVSGAVSGVSWYAAFGLGILREFNGVVDARLILGAWAGCVLAASLLAYGAWLFLKRLTASRRAPFLPALDLVPGLGTNLPTGVGRVIHGWRERLVEQGGAAARVVPGGTDKAA